MYYVKHNIYIAISQKINQRSHTANSSTDRQLRRFLGRASLSPKITNHKNSDRLIMSHSNSDRPQQTYRKYR
ncbi:hypothetical protein [Dolichospermum sp. UHCC 0259]|uniref:hypothetical protein n=1 Tax=Dolichospermum sp. UHCC 0259 TaxID=2590010 RepID=UPI00144745C8|nr:hypothetical protein [Dolichospermum sp. UHCC 0259]MTJ47032.1 hypothetical protein [Dolichospermum sp. UHCC 0259]